MELSLSGGEIAVSGCSARRDSPDMYEHQSLPLFNGSTGRYEPCGTQSKTGRVTCLNPRTQLGLHVAGIQIQFRPKKVQQHGYSGLEPAFVHEHDSRGGPACFECRVAPTCETSGVQCGLGSTVVTL